MRAYVTSVGEKTTKLCVSELVNLGYDVVLVKDPKTSLWHKLKYIYYEESEDFLRVDADVVCNKNVTRLNSINNWWVQGVTFDWYKQDLAFGGVQLVRKEAIPHLRAHIDEARHEDRPETFMSRIKEFHDPRRFETLDVVCGIQNYKNDMSRVKKTKVNRNYYETYDWDLAKKLEAL